jgi:2-keto-3-deoxy-L-rhamnonate aldolase RhmA
MSGGGSSWRGGAAPLFGRDEDVELIRSFISQAAGTRPSGGGEWGRLSPTRGGERTCSATAASEQGTACALLIETRAAIGNIEEVREVEGIDCLTIAPFDLSTELGVSGHLDAPGLVEAITHAERVIGEAGISPGGAALTQEQTYRLLKKGLPAALVRL